MRILAAWLTIFVAVALPMPLVAKERWMAGYYAGGFYSQVDGSDGTKLIVYCNPWIDSHPAGLLITLPPIVADAMDEFYDITISFSDGDMSFNMLLTQGRALQFSARGDEKFGRLEELVARIKASDGFSAYAQALNWRDDFSSENAGPGIGDLLECTVPDF